MAFQICSHEHIGLNGVGGCPAMASKEINQLWTGLPLINYVDLQKSLKENVIDKQFEIQDHFSR